MKIAILLAVFNGDEYLGEQIDSILNQEGEFVFDLFITDDGSSDKSLEIIDKYVKRFSFIKFLTPPETVSGSASGSFFRGLRQIDCSKYDFISFADQDDIWEREKIERALNLMANDGALCYYSNLTMFWNDGRPSVQLIRATPEVDYDYIFQGGSAGCTYLISSFEMGKVLDRLKNDSVQQLSCYSHDWLIYSISRSFGTKWSRDSISKIKYRQHSKNLHGGAVGFGDYVKKIKLMTDGWYFRNLRFNISRIQLNDGFPLMIYNYLILNRSSCKFKIKLFFNIFNLRRNKIESVILFLILMFNFGSSHNKS